MKGAVVLLSVASMLMLACTTSPRADAQSTTSLEELRTIVDALFAGDPARIEALVRFTQVACAEEPMGLGAPPKCPPGIPDGSLVDAFPHAQCEGGYLLSNEMQQTIENLAEPGPDVVGVHQYQTAGSGAFFYGDHVAVATIGLGPTPYDAGGIFIADGGITGIHYGCGANVETFLDSNNLGEPISLGAALPGAGRSDSAPESRGLVFSLAATLAIIGATLTLGGLARRRA